MRPLLLAALLLIPGAAQAASLGGFAADTTRPPNSAALPPGTITAIAIGGLPVTLEKTQLADVAAALGGSVNDAGAAGNRQFWLCYGLADRTLWLVSDAEMAAGAVSSVVIETSAPLPDWGCSTASVDVIDLGVPGVGAKIGEVTAALGEAPGDTSGRFTYEGTAPDPIKPDLTVLQTIDYRTKDGVVDAVSLSQATSSQQATPN